MIIYCLLFLIKNTDKWTPLCYAVDKGNAEMVLLLLQAGASPHVETTVSY